MSWQTDITLARARLAALEAAELKAIAGEQVSEISYNGGSTKWAKGASLSELTRLLAECRMYIQRLSGGSRTGGVIAPIFGD